MANEQDLLLEHEIDGIREYDNPLPGWWKWLFWASIGYSVYYVALFHIGVGPSIFDDFDTARADYFQAQEAKFGDLEISETTISMLSRETDLMAAMRKRFQGTCATCHGAEANGLAGPNLTDDYWLHGGMRMEIYQTIRNGVKGKAMKSWLGDLGPSGVLTMAAYINSIRSTNVVGTRGQEGVYFDPALLVLPDPAPVAPTPGAPAPGEIPGE